MKNVSFSSDEETRNTLARLDKGEISGFIRAAIKEKAARDGLIKCRKKKK